MTRLSGSLQQVSIHHIARCVEALTMVKPMLLVLISFLAATLVAAAGASSGQTVVVIITALLAIGIAAAGVSGAGVLLMDRAREIEPRSLIDAGVFGLVCLLKALLLVLIYFLIFVAVTVVAAIIFFVCKTPGIGPLLFGLTFPLVALVYGVMGFSMFAVIPLTLPALWAGSSVTGTLGVIVAMIKERLMMVVLSLLLLYVICLIVGGVVAAVVLGGIGITLSTASEVIGYEKLAAGFARLFGPLMGGGFPKGGGGSGYFVALSIDMALMGAVVIAVLSQVWIMGINLVYLSAAEDLNTAAAQEAIREGLAKTKNKADEMRRYAQDAAERARHAAESARARAAESARAKAAAAPPVVTPGAAPATSHCPACNGATKATDVFCGHCGNKLR